MVHSKSDREKQKLITDKCQSLIEGLLREEDNKYCVDCDAKGPRWASWNLGVFLCIRCAGIHRNLGVHISRVKSVNLDAWTPEHVAYVQRMGNRRAREIYEANLPDDFRRPQTDTALESFIRAKYEQKKYISSNYVDPGPPAPAFSVEEEIKKLREQKRSKAASSNISKMMNISIPSDTSATKQPRPSSNNASKAPPASAGLVDIDILNSNEPVLDKPTNKSAIDLLIGDLNSPIVESAPSKPVSGVQDLLFGETPSSKQNLGSNILDLDLEFSNTVTETSKAPASEGPKKVLTKESILSLYSSPSSPATWSDPRRIQP